MTSLLDFGQGSRGEWRFRLFSIPVRVQPWFWVAAAFSGRQDTSTALIWIAVCFGSILLHEMGHAMAFRLFGVQSEAILYAWGGLAVPKSRLRGDAANVLVFLAGPVAGFILAGVVIATVILGGAKPIFNFTIL
ncbi:MAG TPA: site-2 protease family protein [Bryobacteraceae bacterium]|nr:site-2 protease family protein [Bryobacteraceae bacterium]